MILLDVDRLLARFDRQRRWRLLGILVVSALHTALAVTRPLPIKVLIEPPETAGWIATMRDWAGSYDRYLLIFLGLSVVIEVGIFALRLVEEFASTRMSESFIRRLRGAIAASLLQGPYSAVSRQNVGRIIAASTGDVEVVQRLIKDVVVGASIAVLQLLLMLGVIWFIHPSLLVVLLAEMAILAVAIGIYSNWRKHAFLNQMRNQERFVGWLSGIQQRNLDLRYSPARGLFQRRLIGEARRMNRMGVTLWRRQSTYTGGVELMIGLCSALCVALLFWEAQAGGQPVGSLLVFLYYAMMVFPCLSRAGEAFPLMTDARNAYDRLSSLLGIEPQRGGRDLAQRRFGRIELRGVGVKGDGDEWIMRGVNLTIEAGETVALFGESGSGKSTILQMILGLRRPDEGQVLIDGVSVEHLTLAERKRFFLLQRSVPIFFSGSVEENLLLGWRVPKDQLAVVLEQSRIAGRLAATEEGLHTAMTERGEPFSQGEGQRLSAVRLFLAPQPCMILDEALNSLDEAGELAVCAALTERALQDGRSFLFISHRLSVASAAPRLIRIERGRGIVEDRRGG